MGRHHRGPDLGLSPDKDPHGRHGGRGTAKAAKRPMASRLGFKLGEGGEREARKKLSTRELRGVLGRPTALNPKSEALTDLCVMAHSVPGHT